MGCSSSSCTLAGVPRPGPPSPSAEKAMEKQKLEEYMACSSRDLVGTQSVSSFYSRRSRDLAPAPTTGSQAHFMDVNQTIIIFDWDDTICPSTWLRDHHRLAASGVSAASRSAQRDLAMLAKSARRLLEAAMSSGEVVFVTNARRPWVETSCEQFLPDLMSVIVDIPVIYAMELVKEDGNIDRTSYLTQTKVQAMKAAVTTFYSQYANQSWKNIVSIGDALFEHDAIRFVTAERCAASPAKKIRTKTLKMLEGPTITGISTQCCIIENWLQRIVAEDSDVSIDFSEYTSKGAQWSEQFSRELHL